MLNESDRSFDASRPERNQANAPAWETADGLPKGWPPLLQRTAPESGRWLHTKVVDINAVTQLND